MMPAIVSKHETFLFFIIVYNIHTNSICGYLLFNIASQSHFNHIGSGPNMYANFISANFVIVKYGNRGCEVFREGYKIRKVFA